MKLYRHWLVSCGLATSMATGATHSYAVGAEGSEIDDSNYTIDFHEGPVLHGSRILGMAGSIATLSPGVEGYSVNPSSAAARTPWSRDWFDWELDGSIGTAAALSRTDFDNNGDSSYASDAGLLLSLGIGFQFGGFGVGLHTDINRYEARARAEADDSEVNIDVERVHLVGAHAFFDGQLMLGAGLGTYSINLSLPQTAGENQATAATVSGSSIQVGATWSPTDLPVRVGGGLRVGFEDDAGAVPQGVDADADGNYVARGYVLPRKVLPPTELHLGVATQLFQRLNQQWVVPRTRLGDRRAAARRKALEDNPEPRGHLLIAAGVKVTLPVDDAVGIDSFLKQEVERSGRYASFSPRLGIEGEPWIDMLKLRAGTYLEPTRFASSSPRLHWTAGTAIHIPVEWNIFGLADDGTTFRIGGAVDRAARYFGWSASVGIWR